MSFVRTKWIVGWILFFLNVACGWAQLPDDLNLGAMIQPISDENVLYHPDFYNWGSSIVKGDDGKYHLFYAQMTKANGFYSWLTHGVISRAVADNPAGPYTHVETVLKGRGAAFWDGYTAHNPRVKRFNGKYYLYYMSTNPDLGHCFTAEQMRLASNADLTRAKSPKQKRTLRQQGRLLRERFRKRQRIGVLVADRVTGPWTRLDHAIVEPAGPIVNATSNPAVVQRPDGSYLMLFKGDRPHVDHLIRTQAIALADDPVGPWTVQDQPAVGDRNSEDPSVWYDSKRQRYYGISHAFGYMGLITSTDGLHWDNAKHDKVLEKSIYTTRGREIKTARLERPFVYLEEGIPKVLTAAVREKSGKTYCIFIPLAPEAGAD